LILNQLTPSMLRAPSKNNMSNIRDLFSRDHKEKVPPDLQRALSLLHLNGYEDLEDRFLSTDAFLRPWSVFRDSLYLLSPEAVPRGTRVIPIGNEPDDGVSRLDILWFYTQFDEGTLRYDPRADRYNLDYTPDTSLYGVIDKTKWRVEEHERHLYAWLLQEFKVGKGYSPWRFECFELKNICTVWEEVFVPIVNAVRTSYSPLGRRHYGRLALFIETRCPSSLAFPSSNIGVPEGGVLSPTPYRIVSMPRKTATSAGTTPHYAQEFAQGVLTKKNYDAAEKELRDVYPQYGGLVERPKFKHKMEEWLAEQRARAHRRKGMEKHGRVQSYQPSTVSRNSSRSPVKQSPRSPGGSFRNRQDLHKRSVSALEEGASPIKRYSDGIKRSFSTAVSSMRREEQKNPLHGVTRQLHFPERTSSHSYDPMRDSVKIKPLPRPEQHHEESDVSVFTSMRNSNPFTKDMPNVPKAQRARADTDDSVFSPMAQLSAIPRPLQPEFETVRDVEPVLEHRAVHQKKSYNDVRIPSYEGTEYEKEISLTDLHTRRMHAAHSPKPARTRTPATRLPAPIIPIPYGDFRVASADTPTKARMPVAQTVLSPPKLVNMAIQPVLPPQKPAIPSSKPVVPAQKSVVWPGPPSTLPKATAWPDTPSPKKPKAWPGFDSDDEDDYALPPVPSKSPERQIRNPSSRQPVREEVDNEVFRIVSRENIRQALGGISRESSNEQLVEPARTMSPVKQQLKPYNTHLFPRKDERKGVPVGAWVKGEAGKGRYDPGGAYELEVLKQGKDE
jgi:hypothetical protein